MSNKTMRELLAELASARSQLAHADVARGITEEANAKLRAGLASVTAERDALAAKVVVMGEALASFLDPGRPLDLDTARNMQYRQEVTAREALATLPARIHPPP